MNRRVFNRSMAYFCSLNLISASKIFSDIPNFNQKLLIGLIKPYLCGTKYYLLPEVFEAFEDMKTDAKKDGLSLWCTSGYRSFLAQKQIWNTKYYKIKTENPTFHKAEIIKSVIEYSSIPGTSRHHWGTDLDIIDAFGYEKINPLSTTNFELGGDYQFLSYWLNQNAANYGFYKVYTNEINRNGFEFEPWHYSYKKLSVGFLKEFLMIDLLKYNELKSCLGFSVFDTNFMDMYNQKYMLGINLELIG